MYQKTKKSFHFQYKVILFIDLYIFGIFFYESENSIFLMIIDSQLLYMSMMSAV